jgi:hypothetical protein
MTRALPDIPSVNPQLITDHAAAHHRLDRALDEGAPGLSRLLTRSAARTMVAAIANVRPTIRGRSHPPLFSPPRSFLSPTERLRLEAAAAAYRYVDSRLAVVRMGLEEPPALLPEAPYVLHAFAEGRVDNPMESNPGMIRAVEFFGNLPTASYPPPSRRDCRQLLGEAIARASTDKGPAAVRASWLLYVTGEIHPFSDGNGRVARLLHLLVTGEEMPNTVDWGIVEQLRFHQESWSETLKDKDVTPCVQRTIELSTAGAQLMLARLEALGDLAADLQEQFGFSDPVARVVVAVWLRRVGRADDLAADVDLSYGDTLVEAASLCAAGVLERAEPGDRPPSGIPSFSLSSAARHALNVGVEALAAQGQKRSAAVVATRVDLV